MAIKEIAERSNNIINSLHHIWECSVRATHSFLSEEDIQKIPKYIPNAFLQVPHLIVIQNTDSDFVGFILHSRNCYN